MFNKTGGSEKFFNLSFIHPDTRWVLGAPLCSITSFSITANPVFPRISSVDTVVTNNLIKQNTVVAAIAVMDNGRIVHAAGYGLKDMARQTPVTTNTVFRWAS